MNDDFEIRKIKETLTEHEKRIKLLENTIRGSRVEEVTPALRERKIDFTRLAQKTGVNSERIKELFDVEGDTLTLLKTLGKDEREKTKEISLTVLLGYKYFFGNEGVLAKELKRNVAESRVPVNNFATYLNELIPSLMRRIGKSKSKKTIYRLTPLGEVEARETIKKLCG